MDLGYYYDQNGPQAEKSLGIVENPTNIDINFQNKIFPKTYHNAEQLNDATKGQYDCEIPTSESSFITD